MRAILSLSARVLWEMVPFGCVVARVRRSSVRGRRRAVSACRVRERVVGEGRPESAGGACGLLSSVEVPERWDRSFSSALARRVDSVVAWCVL